MSTTKKAKVLRDFRDAGTELDAQKAHPLTLLRIAYGLEETR